MKKMCPKCNKEWDGYHDESSSNHFCNPMTPQEAVEVLKEELGWSSPGGKKMEAIKLAITAIELQGELVETIKELLDGGPDCDCPPEGHVCGWPGVKQNAEALLAKCAAGVGR